jgi:hypothetical protein
MKSILTILFLSNSFLSFSQLKDYTKKTQINQLERTQILNTIRNEYYSVLKRYKYQRPIKFVVKSLFISNNYAWFEGEIVDSLLLTPIPNLEDPEIGLTWNSVGEALLFKTNKKWTILESQIFPLIFWWEGIKERHPDLPCEIFSGDANVLNVNGCQ